MTSDRLDGQTVLVIGGSSGIGQEIARQASEEGARLIIAGRNPAKLAAAAEGLSAAVQSVVLDAHDEAAVETAFFNLDALDHVVSMVGDSMSGSFLTTEPETMRHVLHSKFWSNWIIGRNAAGRIRDRGSVTFTSGTGARAHEASATCVANLGVSALVQGLAYELAPRLRVNAVAPTFMGTATSCGVPSRFSGTSSANPACTCSSSFSGRSLQKEVAVPMNVGATALTRRRGASS
jgi:NAD(P)-dependent dehydrogenase (short-subunit alcohol dehydrogenase family)